MSQAAIKMLVEPGQVQVLAQPLRVAVLEALRNPDSAAGVSRIVGKPRQKVNYHLKELERAGLVQRVGERRKGNFVEQLYQSVAKRFVVAQQFAWDVEKLSATLADQVSLAELSAAGERLQHDASVLLDLAAYEGRQIPSATAAVDVRFEDESSRAAFMQEYLETLKHLLNKHGSPKGAAFHVITATYPDVEEI